MKKKKTLKIKPSEVKFRWVPHVVLGFFMGVVLWAFKPTSYSTRMDVQNFASLPVLNGGRLKPLDSMARSALLVISGKQTVRLGGVKTSAIEWLLMVLFDSPQAHQASVFQIDDPEVLGLMGIEQSKSRFYSFHDLHAHLSDIETQAIKADQIKPELRSRFQKAVLQLSHQLMLYQKLQNTLQMVGKTGQLESLMRFETDLGTLLKSHMSNPNVETPQMKSMAADLDLFQTMDNISEFLPIPVSMDSRDPNAWVSLGRGILNRARTSEYHPAVVSYASLADAYRIGDAGLFNRALSSYRVWLGKNFSAEMSRVHLECIFNRVQPFYLTMMMYVAVFLLAVFSWLMLPQIFSRTAFHLLILTFVIHTIGLIARIVLQGRPPVTNLYSSAIFVGWVAVLLGLILERLFRKGLGSAVAAAIGFVTLIIAHHLAAQGDTLEMMRAVLDSNFWLATHVVCITIGYSSTFLAGVLAIVYLVRRLIDKNWDFPSAQTAEQMVFGVVCFSTFFSFLGTILGGIWADQSWGRFWGWDPKENGALMIVLWNVFILHARLSGLARGKNMMMLAVGGNMVTALSWFGVNMLGIGLHSYGFMDKAFVWLMIFLASQLALISLGFFKSRSTPPDQNNES